MTTRSISPQDIRTFLEFRHACKRFDPEKKIPQADIDLLLEAARLAPSSYGFEQWNIIVVQSETVREAIRKVSLGTHHGQLPTASHFLIFTAKTSTTLDPKKPHIQHILRDIKGLDSAEAAEYELYWNNWAKKDFGLYDASQLLHEWAARQAYIALGAVMTVAAARGIDSCPIEGFNLAKVTDILTKNNAIDPAQDLPVVMLALGYRVDPQSLRRRRNMDEIVKTV